VGAARAHVVACRGALAWAVAAGCYAPHERGMCRLQERLAAALGRAHDAKGQLLAQIEAGDDPGDGTGVGGSSVGIDGGGSSEDTERWPLL
jgi:hypothetical protein